MGRPKGSRNKSTILREQMQLGIAGVQVVDTRSDEEIITDIENRFKIYRDLIRGAGEINSLIVSGSAGVGKSWTADEILQQLALTKGFRYHIVKTHISAFDLYELAYNMRNEKDVIILDDADAIFEDEQGLNILKSLLDTSAVRKVSWMSDHARFKGDDGLPKEFYYEGSMVFLTNRNFQHYIDTGYGKNVDHMKALLSRSIYLDLKMHTRREVSLWVNHIVTKYGILQRLGDINSTEEKMLSDWVVKHKDDVRELSVRTALNLGKIYRRWKHNKDTNKTDWETNAKILFLKKV